MRVVLVALLMLATIPAWAQWLKVEENDIGTVFYLDPATIRTDGNLRRVWGMQDLKTPGSDGALSRRGLNEFNCKEGRFRVLAYSHHSGRMLTGETLLQGDSPSEWHHILPDTPNEVMFKFVCSRQSAGGASAAVGVVFIQVFGRANEWTIGRNMRMSLGSIRQS